jgi:pimeloyl-ACP methyl ester carboxylesterase
LKAPAPERLSLDLPLYVERVGHGPPLILLHGFGASRVTWRFWVPELARRFTVYLVDLRGFGSGGRVDPPRYAPADMSHDVVRMILALDLRDVTIVGHSIGGGVGLLTTLMLGDAGEGARVVRLISIAGTTYAQKIPRYVDMLRHPHTQLLLLFLPTGWLIRKVLESIVYDVACITEEMVEGYAGPLRAPAAKRAAAAAALQLVPADLEAITRRYRQLDVPTLILWGRQDPVVPLALGERLAEELPNARLVVMEKCGHVPSEERPEESLRVVLGFLGSD